MADDALLASQDAMAFIVGDQRFSLSPTALSSLGAACMLNQMVEEAGTGNEHVVTWPAPLTVSSFAHVVEWAMTSCLPAALSSHAMAELFRAADALCVPELASRCLALGPPPSAYDHENSTLLEVEQPYFVDVCATTFVARRAAVDLPLAIGGFPRLFQKGRRGSRGDSAPLFNTPGALATLLEERLPPEAHICLSQGLCLAGGFVARLAASLARLCDTPPAQPAVSAGPRPDIDFFVTTTDSVEALRVVRATLIALSRYCEEQQNGMCVIRSPYALTVAMDDCDFDLQIVLCAFESMEDVLVNFDVDACRVAYDGTRLVASETFVRATVSGVVIARPQNESANYAKRLHKYATELGYELAIADHDPATPGKTFKQLRTWEHGPPSASQHRSSDQIVLREFEREFDSFQPDAFEEYSRRGRNPLETALSIYRGSFLSNSNQPEIEAGPAWGLSSQARSYERPPVKQPRLLREIRRQFTYNSVSSREIVEVWRGQRRRTPGVVATVSDFQDYWRFEAAAQMAHKLSAGAVRWRTPMDGHDLEKSEDDANYFCMKDVVFQQLDMHPVRGAWNEKQKAFIAEASDSAPLVFLDLIEDASLAVPIDCREKLSRCLRVPTRDEAGSSLFNRPWATRTGCPKIRRRRRQARRRPSRVNRAWPQNGSRLVALGSSTLTTICWRPTPRAAQGSDPDMAVRCSATSRTLKMATASCRVRR